MDNLSRILAVAAFEEQDAGSGPVHSSPSLGPMSAAVHNIADRQLHDISVAVPDDRQFLRAWRRQLQEALTTQNTRMIEFLTADVSGAPTAEVTRRCTDVLARYSRPTLSFTASTRDLRVPTVPEPSLDEELGISPVALREILRRAIRSYVNSAAALCAAENSLEDKLKRLETIVGRVNDLMFLEPTAELGEMAGPIRAYLDSVLDKISFEADYKEMLNQHKKFTVLKGLLTLANFQQAAAPICKICMTKEVTYAVTPCGHTYCEDCCSKQMTSCFTCRVQIRDRLKLFFG